MIDIKVNYEEGIGGVCEMNEISGPLAQVIIEAMGILKAIYNTMLENDPNAAAYFRWCMTVGVSLPYLEGADLSKYVKELFDLNIYKGGND